MTARQSSPSDHSRSGCNVRKRVCKACDRCRLKKSKCDGAVPCGRCRTDNAICTFGERKKAHDKVYPLGYVEMLEQQQAWLVYGLQELYRRSSEGECWSGEPLKCEANGHPLTHDLLMRLGALDQTKGERFEENTEVMQQALWKQYAGHMQWQDSLDGTDSVQAPNTTSRFTDASPQNQLSPTRPNHNPVSHIQAPTIKPEPQMAPHDPAYIAPLSMQEIVYPIGLQGTPQWPNSGFGTVEDVDMMGASDFTSLSFNDQLSSPMFNRQMPINCVTSDSFTDTTSDYEDFNQFLNANPTETMSI
ncbi:hypothetical protein KXW58_004937 [Aspergillus fumigatus]|nr:hypothetical protein KXW58_004937 [Aspergillus fumigatus]